MDAVKAALQRLTASTYTYAVTGDYFGGEKYRASGSSDPKAHADSRTYVISGGPHAETRKVIVIGGDGYENRDGQARWVHSDLTRLRPSSAYRVADPRDPGGLAGFTAALHSARRLDPHRLEGEAKLEVKTDELTYLPVGAPILRFSQGGLWVSYTLTTDAKGVVTSIRTVFETAQSGDAGTTTTFSSHGRPVKITKPARATELRRSLYAK